MSAVQETRIYVGNINPDTTKVALKEAFEKVGTVSKLRVLQRRRKTIVYAFITFEAAADAKKAIGDLNETELDGNKIIVQEARPIDEEILTQRKENKKQNRKLKRQAQQQAKKEEVAAKKDGDDSKKEETKITEETETETKPKKKNNRKRKAKKEGDNGSEEVQSEPTKKDAPAVTKKSPEPAKKEVNKEEDAKAESSKKEQKKFANPDVKNDEKKDKKPEPKKEEIAAEKKKEVDNKTKSTSNKQKSEKAVKSEEKKGEAKDGESKSNRISPETGVFVANLPFSAKTEDLQELFKDFNIKTAKIARGYRSKGYGFVEAATVEEQQKILKEFKEVEFKERIITVKPLLSKSDDE